MVKLNMSMHAMHLHHQYSEYELSRRLVIPYPVSNRFRPCLLAIQKIRPITYRTCTKVLGRSLLAVTVVYRCKFILDGFMRECRSGLPIVDNDDHAGCESPKACDCRYFKYRCCRRYFSHCWGCFYYRYLCCSERCCT
jgi:hypothetical protein